jgi:hypothetical protein
MTVFKLQVSYKIKTNLQTPLFPFPKVYWIYNQNRQSNPARLAAIRQLRIDSQRLLKFLAEPRTCLSADRDAKFTQRKYIHLRSEAPRLCGSA